MAATTDDRSKILLVDDDAGVLRAHTRVLENAGLRVEPALSGAQAIQCLRRQPYDAVLSDIDMPDMNGIQLLEQVRAVDLDVPVVFVTGAPSTETAIAAIERGALRYLLKPVEPAQLVKVTHEAVQLHAIAKAKRQALELAGGANKWVGDQAGLGARFNQALDALTMVYQPIVSWKTKQIFAYEALLRSTSPGLTGAEALLDAAERLGKLHALGRRIRLRANEAAATLRDDQLLFVNLHPADLIDDDLFSPQAALSAHAKKVVLEITERESLHSVPDVQRRVHALRDLGFRIAIDDLGAGYAGLSSFALLEPDVVKLDMSLVRNVEKEPKKLTLVQTLVTMCRDLGMQVTAEGVETPEERDVLLTTGCDLLQGYLFARPGPPFPEPKY